MASASAKDFFISYNKADRTWAEWIAWELEAAGYSSVVQAWDFRPGDNFRPPDLDLDLGRLQSGGTRLDTWGCNRNRSGSRARLVTSVGF